MTFQEVYNFTEMVSGFECRIVQAPDESVGECKSFYYNAYVHFTPKSISQEKIDEFNFVKEITYGSSAIGKIGIDFHDFLRRESNISIYKQWSYEQVISIVTGVAIQLHSLK